MVSATQMAAARCTRLRFLLTVYICIFKGVCLSLLYKRLLIVVFMLVVNPVFCLSEAGSAEPFVGCSQRDFSCHWPYVFYRSYIVTYLVTFYIFNQTTHDVSRLYILALIGINYFLISSLVLLCELLHRTVLSSYL